MKNFTVFLAFSFSVLICKKQIFTQNIQESIANYSRKFFIENKGQWSDEVLYLARLGDLDVWITKNGVNYTFYKIRKKTNAINRDDKLMLRGKFDYYTEDFILLGHRVTVNYEGANINPTVEGKQKKQSYYNYFLGKDPSKHASFVGLYEEVIVKNVYDGIDIRYYFERGSLRYDYIVNPGADPLQIKFKLSGQYDICLKNKDLVYTTRFGEVRFSDMHAFQQGKTIESRFVKNGEVWQIALGNYDKSQLLIIDPLVYSTFIGGSGLEYGYGIALDVGANAYITGWTASINYDVVAGAFQTTYGSGSGDVFVTKLNSTGDALLYSTYIGGDNDDRGYSIALESNGNAYITGWTTSINFPITAGAFQNTHGGNADVFITKLNSTGSALEYSTYLGGNNGDIGYNITLDGVGNAYITGSTYSTDFDVTPGAFQATKAGPELIDDAFVTKLNSIGNALLYSTYLGGTDYDGGYGIVIDASGNAYVTGYTESTDYAITAGAFQTTHGGHSDVFITKLNSAGSALEYSTYLGGSNVDFGLGIALDGAGSAYVTGTTWSIDYDVTSGAYKTTNNGDYDVFVTKLNSTGSGLVYSTYIGGISGDVANSIAIDGSGNAYLTGNTASFNYDVTPGAFQSINDGGDAFVTILNSSGNGLLYSTCIGGNALDDANSIAIDSAGDVYIIGITQSIDFDITTGVFQTVYDGVCDVFVTKLNVSYNTSLENIFDKNKSYSIYPNPNNGTFILQSEKEGVYELMDVSGKVINIYQLNIDSYSIEENLQAGIYFLRKKDSGTSIKIVVQTAY